MAYNGINKDRTVVSQTKIAGRLKKEGIKVSHESIYAIIRADDSGELSSHCRHKMKYKRKNAKKRETKATNIRNRVSIHERPKEADGTRFKDWEMDLIVDKEGNAILTLLERSTNFMLIEKLKQGKKAKPLAKTVWRLLLPYKGDALNPSLIVNLYIYLLLSILQFSFTSLCTTNFFLF